MPLSGCAAASVLVAPLFDGRVRRLHAVHSGPHAHHLADESGRVVVCVMKPGAVRLPHAVVLSAFPDGSPPLSVGDGMLGWNGFSARVTRWWAPARPRLHVLADRIARDAAQALVVRWRTMVGRGVGLTPYADDVLCGALVALRAAEHPLGELLASAVATADLERRTTAASAALLRFAALGWCIDALAAYLASPTTRHRAQLVRIGGSSGRGLLDGVRLVLPDIHEGAA